MILTLANIAAIVAIGLLVVLRGRDRHVGSIHSARWLRIAGLIPLGLQVAILLLFGVGEMTGGDLSGAAHLAEVAAIALLAILAWMRPLEGGIALFVAGAVYAASFVIQVVRFMPLPRSSILSPAMLIQGAPQMLSGVLFFIAGMLARRATAPQAEPGR